jgi:glycosyltransferase involved in cell wall biosynthesis
MKGPPRILFVVESGTDARLVDGLAERAQLTVLARRIPDGREISQPTERTVKLRVGPSSRTAFAMFAALWLMGHRSTFDVVIVQGYGPAAAAINALGRLTRTQVVMLVCSPAEAYYACRRLDEHEPFRRPVLDGLRALARLNARIGTRYVVLSQHLADVVRAHGARRPIDIIPVYGVDTAIFRPTDASRPALRRALGLPIEAEIVIFSSRIAPEKDADTLLRAVQRLRGEGRNLVILHRSEGYQALVERATELGIADAVDAGDAVPPSAMLAHLYQAADVCVQASRAEGLGFAPLEALACGTPVIAAAVGGLRETIVYGVTGWTYRAGDADGLVGCLRAVLDNRREASARAARGRELVASRFERRVVFDQLFSLIYSLDPVSPPHIPLPAE